MSASEQGSLARQMEPFDIDRYFACICGIQDHLGSSKVDIAKKLIKEKDASSSNTVFIGDTFHDWEVAEAVECHCILIANGHQSSEILKMTPAKVVNEITEVIDFLL